ncbi:MAG: cyclase family protein [Candidatus Odinarchaeia archaeon]
MIIDLSYTIHHEMLRYPGDPPVAFVKFAEVERDKVNLTQLILGSHSGTHIDAPKHFVKHGLGVDKVDLAKCFGEAILLDLSEYELNGEIDVKIFRRFKNEVKQYKRVVVKTGWFKHWGEPKFFSDYPELTVDTAHWLVEHEIELLGVDTPSVGSPEVHKVLLEKNIVIIENLNLADLNVNRFTLIALPLRMREIDGSPIRAVAII